jgi:hypothetical protein
MSEYQFNENGYGRHGKAGGEVQRDGLAQSILSYYSFGPQHDPEPNPFGYDAGEVPAAKGERAALLALAGLIAAIFQAKT